MLIIRNKGISMAEVSDRSLVTILIPNIKGQLGQVASFCAENDLNILRLTLSAADKDDKIQRIIAYLEGNRSNVNTMCQKLMSQIETILQVRNFQTNSDYVEKELCLCKIKTNDPKISDIINLIADAEGKTIYSSSKVTIFSIEDTEENVNDFFKKLVNISSSVEIARSGMVAIAIDDKINLPLDSTNL
jgi:acetolactate synthase small subunit